MNKKVQPQYPIYIPSKNRADKCMTADFLHEDSVAFTLVVEPQDYGAYAKRFGADRILQLPWDDPGSVIPARNWIKQHATQAGHKRHWQIDDNCRGTYRLWQGKCVSCAGSIALRVCEDFADRYENVAVAGLNYEMFVTPKYDGKALPPFNKNCHVYSCNLILNETQHEFRGPYNEDTDYCLQVLSDDWCTILLNAFMIDKQRTMTMEGGNTDELYQGDGRLEMARSLQRRWPRVVSVSRKWGRPQHVVNWKKFDTPLKRRDDINIPDEPNEYGMVLKRVKDDGG